MSTIIDVVACEQYPSGLQTRADVDQRSVQRHDGLDQR
jgi:hypothetical protein